ncbi:GNAT family N-acetyltransferase [Rhizobium metallidurans]|uniref:GNAT superfamily N-acetyltransferase n=1 Tax=Rhizobium metallidurans TaxID=1265931 RepID=A0A7W6CY39_9HYPH|nr:GNAT family N-acetyltransferase [Rhizobium metallidurans]MBB3967203.1 GNAT superfamily N-acetyltransferase [Rhizobium metallidurans]
MKTNPPLPMGYSELPRGKLANVVTCLEMRERPEVNVPASGALRFERWRAPALDDYRRLFREVGENWLWLSRLIMDDDELGAILHHPDVEIYVILSEEGRRIGLLELDFRQPGECELVFCGLVADAIGQGAGKLLITQAVARAWARPINRFWLHTCHFDHPSAISFYQKAGFKPYGFLVEVVDDPRLSGHIPETAAPHVPLLRP